MALDADATTIDKLAALLSAEERQRAAAFRLARDRRRYIVCRGRLRELLAHRLGCRPADVPLSCTEAGKPFVPSSAIRFNLAHAGALALCVIAWDVDVGCDIEWRIPRLASRQVARSLFSALELEKLAPLRGSAWLEAFFNCWTRKEAVVKGLGCGLCGPLASFDVSLLPDEPVAILRGAEGWSLQALEPVPGLHAAIAVKASAVQLIDSS
jgi:4'-phosphopantetheinyl transferase